MTSFAVQTFTPSVVSALASNGKGSVGNRIDCAGAQVKNSAVTGLQAGVATVATGAAVHATKTSPGFAKGISKAVDFVMNKVKNATKSAPAFTYNPDVIYKGAKFSQGPNTINKSLKGVNIAFLPKATFLQKVTSKMKLNLNQLAEKVLTMSPKGKAGLAIAAVALPVIAYIAGKGLYQAGQIDQKYTDKAKCQNAV